MGALVLGGASWSITKIYGSATDGLFKTTPLIVEEAPKIKHIKTPEAVKAIYMSSWVAGTKDWRGKLVDMIKKTELNSVVIDVKDYTGRISFDTGDPAIKEIKEATEIAFQTRGEVLYLRGGNDIPVKRGNLESIRMGIYNTASKEVCYRVAVRCLNAFTIGNSCVGDQNAVLVGGTDAEGNRPVQNWFTQLNAEQSILGSDAYSSPVTLKLPTQLKPDTYVIEILAYKELNEAACPGIDWAPEPYVTKRFNLVVT